MLKTQFSFLLMTFKSYTSVHILSSTHSLNVNNQDWVGKKCLQLFEPFSRKDFNWIPFPFQLKGWSVGGRGQYCQNMSPTAGCSCNLPASFLSAPQERTAEAGCYFFRLKSASLSCQSIRMCHHSDSGWLLGISMDYWWTTASHYGFLGSQRISRDCQKSSEIDSS